MAVALLAVFSGAAVWPAPAAEAAVIGESCVRKVRNPTEWVRVCAANETGLNHTLRGVADMTATSTAVHVQIEWMYLYEVVPPNGTPTVVARCVNCPANGQRGTISTSTDWVYPCRRDRDYFVKGAARIRWSSGQLSAEFAFGGYRTHGEGCV